MASFQSISIIIMVLVFFSNLGLFLMGCTMTDMISKGSYSIISAAQTSQNIFKFFPRGFQVCSTTDAEAVPDSTQLAYSDGQTDQNLVLVKDLTKTEDVVGRLSQFIEYFLIVIDLLTWLIAGTYIVLLSIPGLPFFIKGIICGFVGLCQIVGLMELFGVATGITK